MDEAGDWEGDLARMVLLLAATGARFSQIVRLTVADVQSKLSRIMVPVSRKGRGQKKITSIAVRVGDDVLEALRPVMSGRKGTDVLLLRPRWKQLSPKVSAIEWVKTGREPWLSASELTRPWLEIIKTAELPADIVPYALRHSSIVRALGARLPIRLVAALHDTSSEMIEKNYSAHIVDAMDELAAKAVVPLLPSAPAQIRAVTGG